MKIFKEDLHKYSWYENELGEEVDEDDPSAKYYRSRFPLTFTTHTYRYNNDEKEGRSFHEIEQTNVTYPAGEECIVAMVNSGDYTLREAILLYATACERCVNVLKHKYLNGKEGYPEFSEKWKEANTECEYCKGLKEPTKTILSVDDIKGRDFPLMKYPRCRSTIYKEDKGIIDITHVIEISPYEIMFQYEILAGRSVIMTYVMQRDMRSGFGYKLKRKEDGTLYNDEVDGYDSCIVIKSWKEYFEIDEVKELLKFYNINSEDLFSLT